MKLLRRSESIFALIIDDFHLAEQNEKVPSFISKLLLRTEENFHVIVASRTLPSIPDLSQIILDGGRAGLGRDDLLFTVEEFARLFFA